jgi:hypothetical protein
MWESSTKEGKYKREKWLKRNANHENGLEQRDVRQTDHLSAH